MVFMFLLGAHLIYDFHIQGDFVGTMKGKYDFILLVHCLTYTLVISAVLWSFCMLNPLNFIYIFATHWIVDRWKARSTDGAEMNLTWNLWVDQGLHILVLLSLLL